MRRVFPLFLLTLTPFLANCADSTTAVAPAGAVHSEEAMPTHEGMPTEADWAATADENWWTPGEFIAMAEEEMSAMGTNAREDNVMTLGNNVAFPKPVQDQSIHADDRIIPGTVNIQAGETVTFKGTAVHRLAIYAPGVTKDEILNLNPGPFALYPVGRLYLQPNVAPQVTLKFVTPGKYLVICAIKTHFFDRNMWGWVNVR
jgi:plastocyanin